MGACEGGNVVRFLYDGGRYEQAVALTILDQHEADPEETHRFKRTTQTAANESCPAREEEKKEGRRRRGTRGGRERGGGEGEIDDNGCSRLALV